MFLKSIEEHDILKIVNEFKPKKSMDWNGIDMEIVKNVIMEIVKPLNYIYNLSFRSGIFPMDMKIGPTI